MTATLNDVAKIRAGEQSAEQQAAVELVRMAREQGLSLTGPDGLLKQLTRTVIETALSEEMTEHLGYGKHDPAGVGTGNIRNGTRAKTVLTEAGGHLEIEVPRDWAGTFEPQVVKKRQRRLNGASVRGCDPVAEVGTAEPGVVEPQPDLSDGLVGRGVSDREGVTRALLTSGVLSGDERASSVKIRSRGDRRDERDQRICRGLLREVTSSIRNARRTTPVPSRRGIVNPVIGSRTRR